jgi:peroxiredoxin
MTRRQEIAIAMLLLVCSYLLGQYITAGLLLHSEEQVKVVAIANQLDFRLTDDVGQEQAAADLLKEQPALVYFFAPGCAHCNQLMPKIKPILQQAQQAGLKVVGIAPLNGANAAAQLPTLKQAYGLPSPLFADPNFRLCNTYNIHELTVFLTEPAGYIHSRTMIRHWEDFSLTQMDKFAQYARTAKNSNPTAASTNSSSDTFSHTWLKGYGEYYRPVKISLLISVLLFGIWGIVRHQGPVLPHLASSSLLLMVVLSNAWLFLSGVSLLAAALLLLIARKWVGIVAGIIGMYGIVTLFLLDVHLLNEYIIVPNFLDPEPAMWQVLPQLLVSILLAQLSLVIKRQKFRYPITLPLMVENNSGQLAVKGVSKAERCDVCHQADQFNVETGDCYRCLVKTL